MAAVVGRKNLEPQTWKFPSEFRFDRLIQPITFVNVFSKHFHHITSNNKLITKKYQLYLGEVLDVEYTRQVLCVEASQCEKKNQACQGPGVSVRTQQLVKLFDTVEICKLSKTIGNV